MRQIRDIEYNMQYIRNIKEINMYEKDMGHILFMINNTYEIYGIFKTKIRHVIHTKEMRQKNETYEKNMRHMIDLG